MIPSSLPGPRRGSSSSSPTRDCEGRPARAVGTAEANAVGEAKCSFTGAPPSCRTPFAL